MNDYYRPLVQFGSARPDNALSIAGGDGWFTHAEHIRRGAGDTRIIDLDAIPDLWCSAISTPRADVPGLDMGRTQLMGIVNVTPDSFSDGGLHATATHALSFARKMVQDGAAILDIGGESTRPGAVTVPVEAEIARVEPVIQAIRHELPTPISIDTRKSGVALAAHRVGAGIVNDVSGFTYDRKLARLCAGLEVPVCVMHAQGDPQTMQDNPVYDNVLLDVFDFLNAQISMLVALGMSRSRIIVDPGIGFGKTLQHNLALLGGLSLFHGLGCPILLGASRKGFIQKIVGPTPAQDRMPGSVAAALAGASQGVQIVRVHDVAQTAQALAVWDAIRKGEQCDT